MGLESALNTALTGLTASETTINVTGNNLANASTVGFKASDVSFATQFLQTQSLGSGPTTDNAGINPVQVGLGVTVAGITQNFSQGTVSPSSNPEDMAIQGNGFFVVQGEGGGQYYTRDGSLSLNATHQLTTASGDNLLGYGVDSNFNIQRTQLVPLTIPLGSAMVATPTTNVVLQGTLSPSGDLGTTSQVIQSGTLADGAYTAPTAAATDSLSSTATTGVLLNGNYNYYVSYYNSTTGAESRPSPVTAVTATDQQVTLNLPNPDTADQSQWTGWTIYRNAAGSSTEYQVGQVAFPATAGTPTTFTDSTPDSTLTGGTPPATMDANGPAITASTLLSNVLQLNSSGIYTQVFPNLVNGDTLQFTGQVGGTNTATQSLKISDGSVPGTPATTVGNLMSFMQDSMGIQTTGVPVDQTTGRLGASVQNSAIQIVGNTGTGNAISIAASGLQLVTASGTQTTISLPFTATQTAVGESVSTDIGAYNTLGASVPVHLTAVLQSVSSTQTVFQWYATSPSNVPGANANVNTAVGTGTITFNNQGQYVSSTGSVTVAQIGTPVNFKLDFSALTGLATSQSTLAVTSQDGSAPGVLNSFTVSDNGLISGVFSNGVTRNLGQVELASFANPNGLEQQGQNLYTAGVNSGPAVVGDPNTNGNGSIVGGATELSNADVSTSLINLILASTMYRGNSQVITTVQTLFDQLLQVAQHG
jgi:flagellar hook protein FlgE